MTKSQSVIVQEPRECENIPGTRAEAHSLKEDTQIEKQESQVMGQAKPEEPAEKLESENENGPEDNDEQR